MKLILIGLTLLFTLSFAIAAQGLAITENKPVQTIQQSEVTTAGNVNITATQPKGNRAKAMSRTEAETLRAQETRVLAQSNISDIKVGSVGDSDLVYILVVVLLVVVILSVL